MTQLVAVIDIGKTNKKIALFDRQLGVVAVRQASFPAKMGKEGILVEQIEAIWLWLTRELTTLYRERPFHALSVSTHGATWVALDQTNRPCLPVIAYEHDLGPAGQAGLDEDFYRLCGDRGKLQEETGTCDLPLLVNPAKSIRFAQRRLPAQWSHVRHLVNYPQFWGYLLTGERAAEPTYTANHTFLFDPRSGKPSSAAKALGVDQLIDWNLRKPWERLGVLRGDLQRELRLPPLPVTVGIHDSNAALLPYLVKHGDRDFVLNSTGTWCVAMHKVDSLSYRPEEIGRKIIFNIDALGNSQKVSFLMGGMDYSLYHEAIGGKDAGLDVQRLGETLARRDRAFLPGAYPSQFPKVRGGFREGPEHYSVEDLRSGRRAPTFADAAAAHDLLNVSLAFQSEVALRSTDIVDGTTIFVEGGFRKNPTFLAVLAAAFPKNPVVVTSLAQASAAGAALLGHALLGHVHPQSLASAIRIDEKPVPHQDIPHLEAYRAAWMDLAEGKVPTAKAKPAGKAMSTSVATAKPTGTRPAKAAPAAKTVAPQPAKPVKATPAVKPPASKATPVRKDAAAVPVKPAATRTGTTKTPTAKKPVPATKATSSKSGTATKATSAVKAKSAAKASSAGKAKPKAKPAAKAKPRAKSKATKAGAKKAAATRRR